MRRIRGVRLDDAVTFFLSGWPDDGPRRPSRDTVRTYGWQLKWLVGFCTELRKTKLSDLDAELLRQAMATKEAGTVAHPRTHKGGEAAANSLASATRAMARWLLAQGVPVASDIEHVRPPRVPERIQPRVREDEFKAIETTILRRLVSSDQRNPRATIARDLALIHLMADTGLRAAEVCNMRLDSIDFDTGAVIVVRGKGSKPRALSLIDPDDPSGGATLRLIVEWMQLRSTIRGATAHEMLWVNAKGTPLQGGGLRRILAGICEDAGLDGNRPPHTFRRANFTENYLADPANVNVLAARMGWSPTSRKMVDTYTRGAEIDFARTNPLPSLGSRWGRVNRTTLREVSYTPSYIGTQQNAPAPTTLGKRTATDALVRPRKGRQLKG